MSLVTDNLGAVDDGRALLDDFGLRPFTVTLRVVTWSGDRVGKGDSVTTDTPVTVSGGRRPKLVVLQDRDVVAGGVMTRARYKIGPITPPYNGGGMTPDVLDPAAGAQPTEVFFVVEGPGMPATGMLCKKVDGDFANPFKFFLTLESLGKEA